MGYMGQLLQTGRSANVYTPIDYYDYSIGMTDAVLVCMYLSVVELPVNVYLTLSDIPRQIRDWVSDVYNEEEKE